MQLLLETWQYILGHQPDFWAKTGAHLTLSGTALLAALAVAIPLGILSAQSRRASLVVTNGIGALRAVPSLAIMAAMLPIIGVGFRPALIALTILALPPMLINTQAGITAVDPTITEAARGMGLSRWQIIGQVQVPLALPVIVTGVRTAAVEVIASATLGAVIGAGGLGEYIFAGLSLGPAYLHLMLVGAVTVAVLTLAAEVSLSRLEVVVRHAFHQ